MLRCVKYTKGNRLQFKYNFVFRVYICIVSSGSSGMYMHHAVCVPLLLICHVKFRHLGCRVHHRGRENGGGNGEDQKESMTQRLELDYYAVLGILLLRATVARLKRLHQHTRANNNKQCKRLRTIDHHHETTAEKSQTNCCECRHLRRKCAWILCKVGHKGRRMYKVANRPHQQAGKLARHGQHPYPMKVIPCMYVLLIFFCCFYFSCWYSLLVSLLMQRGGQPQYRLLSKRRFL